MPYVLARNGAIAPVARTGETRLRLKILASQGPSVSRRPPDGSEPHLALHDQSPEASIGVASPLASVWLAAAHAEPLQCGSLLELSVAGQQ